MTLSYNEIASVTTGAVFTENDGEAVVFHRFTSEQEEVYRPITFDRFYMKSLDSAGIKLAFTTDATSLTLAVNTSEGSTRSFFAFDIMVNGTLVGSLQNYREEASDAELRCAVLGDYRGSFELGDGDKTVEIVFPWSVKVKLTELTLDGSYFAPAKKAKKLLTYGDSITHGYDVRHPSNRYGYLLAKHLGADEYCRGIAGEMFRPDLTAAPDGVDADIITVAYGTNDWGLLPKEEFVRNMPGFFRNLRKAHPDTPIYAFTPIWRSDIDDEHEGYGKLENVGRMIAEVCEGLDITVLNGVDFIPPDKSLYGPYDSGLALHPNDRGNGYYYKGIVKAMGDR